jgi:hypothetical protein
MLFPTHQCVKRFFASFENRRRDHYIQQSGDLITVTVSDTEVATTLSAPPRGSERVVARMIEIARPPHYRASQRWRSVLARYRLSDTSCNAQGEDCF